MSDPLIHTLCTYLSRTSLRLQELRQVLTQAHVRCASSGWISAVRGGVSTFSNAAYYLSRFNRVGIDDVFGFAKVFRMRSRTGDNHLW